MESVLRNVKLRRESDPRRAFWPAFGVTSISDDWYRSTIRAVVISWGAPGTVAQPIWKSQTNSERCQHSYGYSFRGVQALSEIHQMYTRNRIPSTYDPWIIAHYRPLNHTVLPNNLFQHSIVHIATLGNQRASQLIHDWRQVTPKQWPDQVIEWYQSNIVSRSSTKSPFSSGSTNAGTHNTSTVQSCRSHSMCVQMIQACRVGEIEFQCHLARFVTSKTLELRYYLAVNQNAVRTAIWWIWGKDRCATRKGGVPDWGVLGGQGECRWWWRSTK